MIYPYEPVDPLAPNPWRRRNGTVRGLTSEQMHCLRQNCTDPMLLFDWPQFHRPPRLGGPGVARITPHVTPRRSVSDALFPRARQKLLVLFFLFPERWFRQVDVLRIGQMGMGATQREIMNLLISDLIRARLSERRRGTLEYNANPDSPLYGSLKALVEGFLYSPIPKPVHWPPEPGDSLVWRLWINTGDRAENDMSWAME